MSIIGTTAKIDFDWHLYLLLLDIEKKEYIHISYYVINGKIRRIPSRKEGILYYIYED